VGQIPYRRGGLVGRTAARAVLVVDLLEPSLILLPEVNSFIYWASMR
jgi:hypothetical protein